MRESTCVLTASCRMPRSLEMSSESSSEVEWEDVEPLKEKPPSSLQSGAGGLLEIVLQNDGSFMQGKRKSKQQNFLEKAVATLNRELRYSIHKVHLLCLLGHGVKLSNECDDPLLQSVLLSLLPTKLIVQHDKSYDHKLLLNLLRWFKSESPWIAGRVEESCSPGHLISVQLLVAVLRSLGLRTRLVLVLNPASFKPERSGAKGGGAEGPTMVSPSPKGKSPIKGKTSVPGRSKSINRAKVAERHIEEGCGQFESIVLDCGPLGESSAATGTVSDGSAPAARRRPREAKCKQAPSTATQKRRILGGVGKDSPIPGGGTSRGNFPSTDSNQTASEAATSAGRKVSSRTIARSGRNGSKLESTTACKDSPYFGRGRKRRRRRGKGQQKEGSESSSRGEASDFDDSDYDPMSERQRPQVNPRKLSSQIHEEDCSKSEDFEVTPNRRTAKGRKAALGIVAPLAKRIRLAADEGLDKSSETGSDGSPEDSHPTEKETKGKGEREGPSSSPNGSLYDDTTSWVEVYIQAEQQWTSLHFPSCSVGQPQLCERHCLAPLSYIIGVESAHCVCDVTARYAFSWCTQVRKERLNEEWWMEEVLKPFSPGEAECQREKEDIFTILYSHPFPTIVSDYKNHPLYALKRHLLKFEAIYPEDSRVLGYCRGEPVYTRECVRVLHTRETWLKEGRVVRRGEEPYKVVKSRKKKGVQEDQDDTVEVFGRWQTEEYIAPPVVDGRVPRNEYGNVELFKPSMLPPGGVHLRIPGIQRVARKLEIDYAPAMMGWDFHSGYCHPVLEGIVVAEESECVLLEAWEQERQIMIEKEIKKREKRAMERWRKLTKGLLIRERVRRRFLDSTS